MEGKLFVLAVLERLRGPLVADLATEKEQDSGGAAVTRSHAGRARGVATLLPAERCLDV